MIADFKEGLMYRFRVQMGRYSFALLVLQSSKNIQWKPSDQYQHILPENEYLVKLWLMTFGWRKPWKRKLLQPLSIIVCLSTPLLTCFPLELWSQKQFFTLRPIIFSLSASQPNALPTLISSWAFGKEGSIFYSLPGSWAMAVNSGDV